MVITSSDKSFVNFNDYPLTCKGESRQYALPAYETFDIAFQFKITDELLPTSLVLKAAVCTPECELLYNPDYQVVPLCSRWVLYSVNHSRILEDGDFPLQVGNYAPSPGQPQVPEGVYSKEDFLRVINDAYEIILAGYDYVSCCEEPVISGIVVFLNGEESATQVALQEFFYSAYVNFPAADMDGRVLPGECFRYCILDEANNIINCSNLFNRISNACKTTVFRYWNDENGYGFNYIGYDDSGVTRITENRIRLWVNFFEPRTPITENVMRMPDGSYRRISTTIEEQWRGQSSLLSAEQIHQLTAMLKHDNLYVINDEAGFDGFMTQIGEPEPDYQDGRRSSSAMVYFNIFEHSSTNRNSNCGGECGIELIDDCAGGGGVVVPCPDKFSLELQVPPGQTVPANQDDGLIGIPANQLNVYREGIYQYQVSNDYSFDSATGIVTWNPALTENERIAIWEA